MCRALSLPLMLAGWVAPTSAPDNRRVGQPSPAIDFDATDDIAAKIHAFQAPFVASGLIGTFRFTIPGGSTLVGCLLVTCRP
jgi:hypothetical protein